MTAIFAPPPALPESLEQFRFWIWLQFIALRIYVLAVTGKKCRFLTVADHWGNVYLVAIGDPVDEAPKGDPFAFEPSAAYRAAFSDGEPTSPLFRRCPRRRASMDRSFLTFRRTVPSLDIRLRGCLRKYGEAISVPDT